MDRETPKGWEGRQEIVQQRQKNRLICNCIHFQHLSKRKLCLMNSRSIVWNWEGLRSFHKRIWYNV